MFAKVQLVTISKGSSGADGGTKAGRSIVGSGPGNCMTSWRNESVEEPPVYEVSSLSHGGKLSGPARRRCSACHDLLCHEISTVHGRVIVDPIVPEADLAHLAPLYGHRHLLAHLVLHEPNPPLDVDRGSMKIVRQ
jgi:hypothetical protein